MKVIFHYLYKNKTPNYVFVLTPLIRVLYMAYSCLLNRQPKHRHDAVHCLVLPAHRARAVRLVIPEARAGRVQAGPILLHDHACHNVLVRLLQFGEDCQAHFHHDAGPVVDLVMLVGIAADRLLDGLLDDLADVVHNELILVVRTRVYGMSSENLRVREE